jgi:hypothetical protein
MKAIKRSIGAIVAAVVVGLATAASAQGQAVRQVMLRIDQVNAIKECSGAFGTVGADKIDLGAIVIDSTGNVRRRTMDLGEFGHDGSTKPVNQDFIAFKVAGGAFPKVNQVMLVLAERDGGGGFGKYLDDMAAKAKAAADAAKRAQGNVQLPGIRLVSAAAQAEAVAAELGKEIAKRLGEALLAAALDQREDDIFPASLQSVSVTGPNFRFAQGKMVDTKVVSFKKGRCDYSLKYTWRLVR